MSYQDVVLSPSETSTLQGRGYKLVRKLGEGSYAKVFLADFVSGSGNEKSTLACKLVDTNKAPKDFVRKFLPRELGILVRLSHPHIIYVHSIFQRRSKYYIFMRFAENGDLLDFVLKNGAVAESQARVWMRQLTLGVQYLHELGIAHRDLKCENILITANFNVKIADFGFARSVIDAKGKRILSSTYCGSLSYAAPEILRGSPYNPRIADIWSLGVILYIMLNKAMPFDDNNIKRLYDQQMHRRWKFRSKVVDALSNEAKVLVTNLLEPDITIRWRMDQALSSDWISMDPRLLILSNAEHQALTMAIEQRKLRGFRKSTENKDSETSKKVMEKVAEVMAKEDEAHVAVELAAAAVTAGTPVLTVIKEDCNYPSDLQSDNVLKESKT